MNWTHRRPFRQQFNYGGAMNKASVNRPLTFREHFYVPREITDQPIDAVRLQLADYHNPYHPCPVHHREEYHSHRHHPYITALSDQQSSVRRAHSSVHSVSTVETDFVHQRVSTIHTFPSSPSIMERQQIINEDNDNIQNNQITNNNEINQPINIDVVQEEPEKQQEPNQCRTCTMLIEIVDQQTQQIRQYTEQIAEQADLLAKLARRLAGIEEGIDDQKSDSKND